MVAVKIKEVFEEKRHTRKFYTEICWERSKRNKREVQRNQER